MDGFIEGIKLGCDEGIDVSVGTEETEGCADGSGKEQNCEIFMCPTLKNIDPVFIFAQTLRS